MMLMMMVIVSMMVLDEQRHYGSGSGSDGDMAHQQTTQVESPRVELRAWGGGYGWWWCVMTDG